MVDAIHDLLEGKGSLAKVRDAIRIAFIEGHSGVWQQAGSWLSKVGGKYPAARGLWMELAQHPQAKIRFRTAWFLDEMPAAQCRSAGLLLSSDTSKKVAAMAHERTLRVAARAAKGSDAQE